MTTLATLVAVGLLARAPLLYYAGCVVAGGLFVYEHKLVRPHHIEKIDRAFFTCNSLIAIALLAFTLGAVAWRG